MYRFACCTLLIAATTGFALLANNFAQDPKPAALALTIKKTSKIADLKAELDDTWKAANKLDVSTRYSQQNTGPDVELRALHDGEYVYFMARWKDETKSTTKAAWEFKDGKWAAATGDEDRFAIAINGNVDNFAEKGCATLCHYDAMGTGDPKMNADLWHWKAARGGLNGFADDQNFNGGEKPRADDAGKGAYEGNANADKTGPKWIWKEGADKAGAFTAETAVDIPADFKPEAGYTVPSQRLRTPDGSRADVTSAAEHKDGWWTVVLKRKLDTGNADDSVLKAGADAHITLAVFDNTGAKTGKEHAKTAAIKLSLEK